jgi:quercetin dioxygenase-like cupin family protein
MPFIDMDDWEWVQIMPGVRAKTPHEDKIMLSYVEFESGADVPDHSHPHEQACRILEGELEFVIDGERKLCRAGDMLIVPGGVPHSARAPNGPAVALDIFNPPREDYAGMQNTFMGEGVE